MHYHVAKGYGHLGYASAQHVVGQRLLTGRGTEKNETEAMRWFKLVNLIYSDVRKVYYKLLDKQCFFLRFTLGSVLKNASLIFYAGSMTVPKRLKNLVILCWFIDISRCKKLQNKHFVGTDNKSVQLCRHLAKPIISTFTFFEKPSCSFQVF